MYGTRELYWVITEVMYLIGTFLIYPRPRPEHSVFTELDFASLHTSDESMQVPKSSAASILL